MGRFGQIFKDFSNWSTVAGVPHIANANTKISRIFWIIVFLVMLAMFCYELYIMIAKYLSFPAAVTTDILFEEQDFPVVTICNSNPYKYSVVQSNSAFNDINDLMTIYKQAVAGTASNDKYGLSKTMSEPYDRDSLADDALVLLSAQMTDSAKAPALYTYQDLIQDCTFSGKQCSASDFTMYVDPVYGACFSFNEDKSLNYSTNREGIQYGLKLMLTVSQSTPSGINDYLPTTHMAGARLTVNSRGGRPSLEANGIDAGVGFQTAVAIVLTQNVRAKPPYGKCIDTEDDSTNYYQNYTYTLETCFNGCKQRNTVKECGCANPRIMKADADVLCTPTESNLACLQHLKGDQTNQTDPNIDILTDCGCNPPCDENSFKPTASLSRFPADNYYVATDSVNGVAGSCDVSNTKFPSRTDCQKWYSTNGLIIQVFFETLSYELYTESASYGVSDIINDLGGQAGLWLGLSVISVVEMVGLILLLFAFCVSGDAIKIRPDENDLNNDQRIKDVDDVRKEIDHIDKRHEESNNFEDLNEKKGN